MPDFEYDQTITLSTPVGDLDASLAWFRDTLDTVELPGMVKLVTFFDPDGNRFMLAQSLADG